MAAGSPKLGVSILNWKYQLSIFTCNRVNFNRDSLSTNTITIFNKYNFLYSIVCAYDLCLIVTCIWAAAIQPPRCKRTMANFNYRWYNEPKNDYFTHLCQDCDSSSENSESIYLLRVMECYLWIYVDRFSELF